MSETIEDGTGSDDSDTPVLEGTESSDWVLYVALAAVFGTVPFVVLGIGFEVLLAFFLRGDCCEMACVCSV